jgi:hypothetical protein
MRRKLSMAFCSSNSGMQVLVLNKEELDDMLRRAADLAVSKLRDDIERTRTPELMDAKELAAYLKINRSTVNRYVERGMPEERAGDMPRYRKTSVDLWLQGKWNVSHERRFENV